MHSRPARHAAHALAAASAPGHGGRVPKGSARFLRNEGSDRAWRCAVADLDDHTVQARILQAYPDIVPPRQRVVPLGARRATTRPLERLTPRPAAAQPGRLRPRAAWAGWASAASPRRLPRPRPDTTAAPAWRPREPGRRAGAASPGGAWQRQPPRRVGGAGARGSAVPPTPREPAPVETAGTGRVPRVSPQRRRGSPLGERRQACLRQRRGAGRGRAAPPSIWRGQACATGRRGLASPGARQRQEQAPPWPARQPALAGCGSRRIRRGCGTCWLASVAPRADALRRGPWITGARAG
jgi:hypothetical protein